MCAVQKINTRHRRLMEALVVDGMMPREVATMFGISEARLCLLRKSPLWQQEENELRKEHRKNYAGAMASKLPKALQAIDDVVVEKREVTVVNKDGALDTKVVYNDPKDRLAAAKMILDRAGLPAAVIIEETVNHDPQSLLDSLEAIRAKKAALMKELGLDDGSPKEVEARPPQ